MVLQFVNIIEIESYNNYLCLWAIYRATFYYTMTLDLRITTTSQIDTLSSDRVFTNPTGIPP